MSCIACCFLYDRITSIQDGILNLMVQEMDFRKQLNKFQLDGEVFFVERYPITEKDSELIKIGLQVLADNFDDGIYNHTVGCAVLCKNGNIYKGVNCDGIHGSCAEYITIGTAISNGERDFDTIVAVHEKHLNCVIPPCGNCRQMLFEYCPDIKVIVNDENGRLIKVKARDLLPFAWKPVVC